MVRAYKGLSKENEALKTSLKAITEATEEVRNNILIANKKLLFIIFYVNIHSKV